MGWKESFNKANDKIKTAVKNNNEHHKEQFHNAAERIDNDIKQGANDILDSIDDKVKYSGVGQFAQQKGFKNKASFVANGALNKFKGTDVYKAFKSVKKGIGAVLNFILMNWLLILIIAIVVPLVATLGLYAFSIAQGIGETPHYYCYTNPGPEIRKSKEYMQYCTNDASYIDFSDVNGHYVVQDGPGPCTACCVLNMLIRFYYSNDINIYNYMWQSNGQYGQLGNTLESPDKNEYNFRRWITGYIGANTYSSFVAKGQPNGSIEFAASFGKPDYTMANWGYLRDPSIDNGEGYGDMNNENWVWDLSIPENNGEGSSWGTQWYNGHQVTIEGTTATIVEVDEPIKSLDDFKELLIAHPAGIIVYRKYAEDSNPSNVPMHGILVTGYDEDNQSFTIVDPAWGMSGGYERLATDTVIKSYGVEIFNNDILSDPAGQTECNVQGKFLPNITKYVYIEEG